MAEKTLNTRVLLKHDTLANWNSASSITLKKGEVAITTVETKQTNANGAIVTVPVTLMKVGDGEKKFSALPWTSALAADVYAWAKENALFVHKDGTGNVVSGIEWDATLNDGKGGVKYTTAAVATAEGLEDLQEAVAAIQKDITDNRNAWVLDTDTRYSFSTDGDKLVVKKTLYTNGVAGTEEAVGTYEFLTADEVAETLKGYYTKGEVDTKLGDYALKSELHAPTTVAEGSGISVTGTDRNYTVAHANTSDASNLVANGRKYVTGLTFDDFGHVTGYTIGEEIDQDLSHNHDDKYKVKQTAVVDPTANGESLTFIDSISQNDQGVITPTKKTVKLGDYTKTADIHLIKVDAAGTADQVAHKLTAGSKQFDGSADVEITATDLGLESAMHFVGALSEAPATAKSGDVYLNTATKKEYVYSEGQGWIELGDEGSHALKTVKIQAGTGLEVTAGGTLAADTTLGIKNGGVNTEQLADKAVIEEKLEQDVQDALALARTALQSHQDISGKADKVTGATAGNFASLDANGNLADSGKKADDFATKAQGEKADKAILCDNFVITNDSTPDSGEFELGIYDDHYDEYGQIGKIQIPLADGLKVNGNQEVALNLGTSVAQNSNGVSFQLKDATNSELVAEWDIVSGDHIVVTKETEDGSGAGSLKISTDITDATDAKAGLVKLGATDGAATYERAEEIAEKAINSLYFLQEDEGANLQIITQDMEGSMIDSYWISGNDYVNFTSTTGGFDIIATEALETAVANANSAVQTVTAPAKADGTPSGIVASRTGNDVTLAIDETITWIFDCGGAGV